MSKQILKALHKLLHGYKSQTTWTVPSTGGRPRRLTRWQNNRFSLPTSFPPDGSLLAMTVTAPGADEEVDTVEVATGQVHTIQVEAREAAFSPDGSRIAFTSFRDRQSVPGFDQPEAVSELYVANADGTGARRLTHAKTQEESRPTWDPSGERIAYIRAPGGIGSAVGLDDKLIETNPDGSCPTVVATPHARRQAWGASLHSPSWIPGEGRGAGPISC